MSWAETFADLQSAATVEELWAVLLEWHGIRGSSVWDPYLLFMRSHRHDSTNADMTAALLCTDHRWRNAARLLGVSDRFATNSSRWGRPSYGRKSSGYQQHRFVPRREADLTVFTQDELDTIDRVLADLDGLNARQVSDLSHEEAGWRLVEFGDEIPTRLRWWALARSRADVATTRARGCRAARSHLDVIRRVDVASAVYETANERFGETRSVGGHGSEYDFVGGPLAAAVFAFRDFDASSYLVPAVRSYTVVDPIFGAVTFAAVLRTDGVVETSASPMTRATGRRSTTILSDRLGRRSGSSRSRLRPASGDARHVEK